MSDAAIEIKGLRKVYRTGFWMRPHVGLDRLDLTVRRGEVFGFIGPNGAGKTTTIKILVGLHRATEGTVQIFGRPHHDPETRQALGFLPERPYFYQHLTARELLRFYGELYGIDGATLRSRSASLLERVDMTRFADVPLGEYSKGMLQRVGLAQTLLSSPELIILDEPMSGLDPLGRALVRDVILEERDAGRTVFFSSHVLHDVETMSDRVSILVGGQLKGVGTMDELLADRTRHVELRVSGLDAALADAALPGRVARRDGERAVLELEPADVGAALDALTARGASIDSLVPVRATLESLLLDAVDQGAPADPSRSGVYA
jgi:ABC-2 type transport system ATP-binding protein